MPTQCTTRILDKLNARVSDETQGTSFIKGGHMMRNVPRYKNEKHNKSQHGMLTDSMH